MARSLNVLFSTSFRTWRPIVVSNVGNAQAPKLGHICNLINKNTTRSIMVEPVSDSFSDSINIDDLSYASEDCYDPGTLMRRASTIEDEQRVISLLKDILAYQDKNVSSWIVENKVKTLVGTYKCLIKPHREGFLRVLATHYSVDHERIYKAMNNFKDFEPGSAVSLKAEEQLKTVLTPQYSWLFKYIGRLENGVKFLVDLRTDVLELLSCLDSKCEYFVSLQQLNTTLRDLLLLWFTVGFLKLERVTWKSSCEMLQKISEYEAVHPVRSWTDLKRRVGLYRRCFVYTHSAMPSEPLVVLHTALCPEIAASTKGIVAATQRFSVSASMSDNLMPVAEVEDPNLVNAAVFYSITSTQRGLQGIELGNYLIKRVVQELQAEFPKVTKFSSLSPIPGFKTWLFDRIKAVEKGEADEMADGWRVLLDRLGDWKAVRNCLYNNSWHQEQGTAAILEPLLMAACAQYLYIEKRRGAALDTVANFHLRNGAVMWRLNWMADMSPRGMTNSCGIMVNYRYFLEDTETNSQNYLENKKIEASDQIKILAGEKIASKM